MKTSELLLELPLGISKVRQRCGQISWIKILEWVSLVP